MIATAAQAMATFEHTDAAFAPDAPALAAAEPVLALIGPPRRRLRAATRQDHASDTPSRRGLFVGRRAEPTITSGQIRGTTEDRPMAIQRRCPQGDVGGPRRMDLVGGHDLMFRFLNGDQRAKLVGFRDLALANRRGVRLEDAQHFVGRVRVAAPDPRPRLVDDTLYERP